MTNWQRKCISKCYLKYENLVEVQRPDTIKFKSRTAWQPTSYQRGENLDLTEIHGILQGSVTQGHGHQRTPQSKHATGKFSKSEKSVGGIGIKKKTSSNAFGSSVVDKVLSREWSSVFQLENTQ